MDNKILEKVEDIVNYIEKSKTYQEYQLLKDKVSNNEKLTNLIEEIKSKQKELVHKKYNKEDITSLEKELELLESKLNEYPLYCDFIEKQLELNNTLSIIKTEIEKCLDSYIN